MNLRLAAGAALIAGAIVAVAPLGLRALAALRARDAAISYCDDRLAALPPGTRVRLSRCGVDMFHASFLRDAAGGVQRLVPLRPPAGSAQEPSTLALAIPVELVSDPDVFRSRPGQHSAESAIADLGDTLAAVGERIELASQALEPIPGFEHGLAPRVTLIEVREVPKPAAANVRLAIAALLALVAAGVVIGRPRDELSAPDASERRPVRWGLIAVAVLVGVLGLARALQWYFDPIRDAEAAVSADTAPAGSGPAASTSPSAAASPATAAEIALLASSDHRNQLTAATMLRDRAITPELIAAVDAALARRPEADVEAQLVCLKASFDNDGSLEFLLQRMPPDRTAMQRGRSAGVACLVDALARRIREAPERISLALLPAIYGPNPSSRAKTLAAYRLIDVPIPGVLAAEATASSEPFRREALSAALALGAVGKLPAVVETALRDAQMRSTVAQELRTNPHHHAARMLANAWLDLNASDLEGLSVSREREQHDVSAALLEVVMDPQQPEHRRAGAAQRIGVLGEVGAVHDLRRIAVSMEPGPLKSAAEGAVALLERQQAGGAPPRMRALPPR